MSPYASPTFWIGTLERAIKTVAQSALAAIGATALLTEVNWAVVAATAGLAAVTSVLTSLADPARADTAVVTDEVR